MKYIYSKILLYLYVHAYEYASNYVSHYAAYVSNYFLCVLNDNNAKTYLIREWLQFEIVRKKN